MSTAWYQLKQAINEVQVWSSVYDSDRSEQSKAHLDRTKIQLADVVLRMFDLTETQLSAPAVVKREDLGLHIPRPAFKPPTLEEVALAGAKLCLPVDECEKFWNYYDSKGWKVGKSPMKQWRSALSGWRIRWAQNNPALGDPSNYAFSDNSPL